MASQDPQVTPSSQSQPQSQPDPPLPKPNPITHNAAIAISILGPIALLLPSRGGATKSTLQNAVLGASTFWGFNQLAADYTGKSITQRSAERWGQLLGISPGEAGGGKEEGTEAGAGDWGGLPTARAARNRELMEAERRRRAEAEGREYKARDRRGLWERIWMGGEQEGWKERRLEEERRALESGRGYGGLIMDQLSEVFGGGGKAGKGDGDGDGDGDANGEGKKE